MRITGAPFLGGRLRSAAPHLRRVRSELRGARRPPAGWGRTALIGTSLVFGSGTLVAGVAPLAGQPPATPEEVTRDYNRAFQSAVWDGLVQRIHPEGLAYLRLAVDILIEADRTDYYLTDLALADDVAAYEALSDAEVVVRSLRWIQANYAGLLSSISGRRTEVIGTVEEGDDRHVVYRTIQVAQGAQPELRIVTLSSDAGRWKVRTGRDLTFLHTALRGIPNRRRAPPPVARDAVRSCSRDGGYPPERSRSDAARPGRLSAARTTGVRAALPPGH